MTWTGQTFTLNQILTSTQMNNLQADVTAQANGDSGAPKQQTAGIADLAVTTAKINDLAVTNAKIANTTIDGGKLINGTITDVQLNQTALSEAVTAATIRDGAVGNAALATSAVKQGNIDTDVEHDSYTGTSGAVSVLSAGPYSLGVEARITSGSITNDWEFYVGMAGTFSALLDTTNRSYITLGTGGANVTIELDTKYILSSPPFDLGDGEIPLFVWVWMNNLGKIQGVQTAKAPPWAYNGPTKITADRTTKDRKSYRNVKYIDEQTGDISIVEERITQEIKNRDMDLLPHPFLSSIESDIILLLDPPETLYLRDLHEAGESVNQLLHNDYIRLDNAPLNRAVPNGVTPSRFKWKNTVKRAGEAVEDRRLQRGPYTPEIPEPQT